MSSLFFRERLHKLQRSAAFTGLALFLIVVVINVIVQGPFRFFTIRNIALIFAKNAPLILVTMGQLLLMLLGIIDISIGVQMAFVNVVAVMLPTWFPAMPYPLAWAAAFAGAVCIAGIHGLIVALLRIPPLLTSFCMIYIVRGINLLIMPKPQGSVPEIIYLTYDMNILGILPVSLVIIVAAYLIWAYMRRTPTIKHVYAVGGNERNAYANGVNVAATKLKMYLLEGVYVFLAGFCLSAMTGAGNPIMGESYGLRSISACILGGVSLAGGWGTMACALYGSGFLVLIQNIVFQLFSLLPRLMPGFKATSYWQNLVSDSIILIGLVATVFTNKIQRDALKEGILKQIGVTKDTSQGGLAAETKDAAPERSRREGMNDGK
ncbi:MAG: ABC transporter permease [Treponema sp.]|jgi:ribose/xylose/arabinose/galactoside ABC-type transport system permease subunit|nr:ABC transporter permease [Treponema sp.]